MPPRITRQLAEAAPRFPCPTIPSVNENDESPGGAGRNERVASKTIIIVSRETVVHTPSFSSSYVRAHIISDRYLAAESSTIPATVHQVGVQREDFPPLLNQTNLALTALQRMHELLLPVPPIAVR